MKIFKTKSLTFIAYLLLILTTILVSYILLDNNRTLNNVITSFFEAAENRSFDYRQSLKVLHKKTIPNKDIVVVAIDDTSLELLWDKYGEWPIARNVYADIIHHIEKDKPSALVFDLLFIKSMKSAKEQDDALISAMNTYDNIYTGMNFDMQEDEVRKAVALPDRLAMNIEKKSSFDLSPTYIFTNCRTILPELLNGKVFVGLTNVMRNNDGVIRKVAPLLKYNDKYYPYLAFKVGANYLSEKDLRDLKIDKNSNLIVSNTKIPLTKDGDAILNWYGVSGTHKTYPLYQVINKIEGKKVNEDLNFKDKIVVIGTTAMSLHDTKSVPIQESVYPGVEVHTTFINNMLDNNFIKQTNLYHNIAILLLVVLLVATIVMLSSSSILAMFSTILFTIAYLFVSYYAMVLYNLWIPVVIPVFLIIITFALAFLAKYLIKSKDFEYQYKLATIDGLTELYNHRFFQETLQKQIEISQRYNQPFSLIIIDIDFFKKFNDTYGHQAGDAVLKQVAETLKKESRATDFVCRYGGEEMSIILPNTNAEEALFSARRINKSIAEKAFYLNNSETGNVTISVGVATFPEDASTSQDLIEFADKGLYYAKEHGRNQVVKINKLEG